MTARKRARLRRAALACAQALGRADAAMRLDVFSIDGNGAIEHYVDAF